MWGILGSKNKKGVCEMRVDNRLRGDPRTEVKKKCAAYCPFCRGSGLVRRAWGGKVMFMPCQYLGGALHDQPDSFDELPEPLPEPLATRILF